MTLPVDGAVHYPPAIKEKAEATKITSSSRDLAVTVPPSLFTHGRLYRIFLEAVPRIQTCSSPLQRERGLCFAALVLEDIGNPREALSLAATVSPKALRAVCYQMVRRKQDLAMREACRVPNKNLQNIALTFVVSGLLKSGDLVRTVEASYPYLDSSKRDLLLGVVAATVEKDPSKMALFVGSPYLEPIALRTVAALAEKCPPQDLVVSLAIRRVNHKPERLIKTIKMALVTQNFGMVLSDLTPPLRSDIVEALVPTPDKEDSGVTYPMRYMAAKKIAADILTVLTQPPPTRIAIMREALAGLEPIATALKVLTFTRGGKMTSTGCLKNRLITHLESEISLSRLWQIFYNLTIPVELPLLEGIASAAKRGAKAVCTQGNAKV